MSEQTLFDKIGRRRIEEAMKIFYDKVFEHPWLGQYFQHVEQEILESQQSDFLQMIFGGSHVYSGRKPIDAHKNMFITDELFQLRHNILRESLEEMGLEQELIDEWIRLDGTFYRAVVKQSVDQCKPQFKTGDILDFKKPA